MTSSKPGNLFLISLLGALSVISPFAIDMYLPGYQQVANDFGVAPQVIALTLSSYFIGLAGGQLFYGPVLDRLGRKKPLAAGLGVFIIASIGCATAQNIYVLIAFRFLQALGGCAAQVASLAMVRDFFPVKDNAKVLSLLFLFIAASPLLAPTIGNLAMIIFSWRAVFLILMVIVTAILLLTHFMLPEAHAPDKTISLKLLPILREYGSIVCHPRFATYAFAGAFSFAGLFTYVAGSPIVFMEGFHLSANVYSSIFAIVAVGFIGGSQVNVVLLRKFTSQQLFFALLIPQVCFSLFFLLGAWLGWFNIYATVALFFICLACAGCTYPNAAALAMAPFTKNTGSAAALLGFLQLGVGAVISSVLSMFNTAGSLLVIAVLAITSLIGLFILFTGYKKAQLAPAFE